jgi:hypothetical protein
MAGTPHDYLDEHGRTRRIAIDIGSITDDKFFLENPREGEPHGTVVEDRRDLR